LCLSWSLVALGQDFFGNNEGVYPGVPGFTPDPNEIANDGVERCKPQQKAATDGASSVTIFKEEANAIASAVAKCATNGSLAQKACLESFSPNISQAGTTLGGMASAASQMQSGQDMCKNNGGALDMAKKAMTA